MGTIIGILFLAGVIVAGIEFFKGGVESASDGSGCGCLIGIITIVFALSFFRWLEQRRLE